MNCPYCNSPLEDDSAFCTECGKPIDRKATTQHTLTQPVPAIPSQPHNDNGESTGGTADATGNDHSSTYSKLVPICIAVGAIILIIGIVIGYAVAPRYSHDNTASSSPSTTSMTPSSPASDSANAATDDWPSTEGQRLDENGCTVPQIDVVTISQHGTDLLVKISVKQACTDDSTPTITNTATRITLRDTDGTTLADAVYDFSSHPLKISKGKPATAVIVYSPVQYWFDPAGYTMDDVSAGCETDAASYGNRVPGDDSAGLIGADASDDQDTSQNSAKEALERQIAHDKPAAQALQMSYTQQIASKSLNMQVSGRIWGYEEIWNQWLDFKARFPKALLIWSGDFANYQRRGTTNFYVVLSGESFSSQSQAQQWCSSAGLGSDDCVVRMIGK